MLLVCFLTVLHKILCTGFNVLPTEFQLYGDGVYMRHIQSVRLPWHIVDTWHDTIPSHITSWHRANQQCLYFSPLNAEPKGAIILNFNDFGWSRLGIEPWRYRSQSRSFIYCANRVDLTIEIKEWFQFYTHKLRNYGISSVPDLKIKSEFQLFISLLSTNY